MILLWNSNYPGWLILILLWNSEIPVWFWYETVKVQYDSLWFYHESVMNGNNCLFIMINDESHEESFCFCYDSEKNCKECLFTMIHSETHYMLFWYAMIQQWSVMYHWIYPCQLVIDNGIPVRVAQGKTVFISGKGARVFPQN